MRQAAAMPGPIAVARTEYQTADRPFQKLHRLVDTYETVLKYAAVLAVQSFRAAGLAHEFPDVDDLVRERIARPSLGDWAGFLRETMRCFAGYEDKLFSPELYRFHFRTSGTKLALQPHFADQGAAGQLLALRNRLAHGATLPDEESRALLAQHAPHLETLLTAAGILAELPLLVVEPPDEEGRIWVRSLMGAEYRDAAPDTAVMPAGLHPAVLPAGHVLVVNPATGTYLDLHPLLLYVECAEEVPTWDERQERLVGKAICRQRKVLFFNDLRSEDRLAALDYWRGHHSRFRAPHPLPAELRARFPKPERPSEQANWFNDFVSEWTAHFVGRERELGRNGGPGQQPEPGVIDRFTIDSPKRVLVVIGAPGLGKSALLAKWADTHGAVRHFIREGDAATYDALRVFENLGRQVSERCTVPWQPPAQLEPAAYRRAFDETLTAAVTKGPVVLVVDGLDEAVRSGSRGRGTEGAQTIVDWLPDPGLLPEGARLIVSTRPELLEHAGFAAKYGQDKAEHLVLDRLSDADVRALLYQVRSKYEVLDAPEYVEAVVVRSEGNSLYLRMLLDDLAEGRVTFGQSDLLPFGRPRTTTRFPVDRHGFGLVNPLPLGVVAYFERILGFIDGEGRTHELPDGARLLAAKRETLQALVAGGVIGQEQADAQIERERDALEGRAGVRSIDLLALYCLAREPLALADAAVILGSDPVEVQRAFEIIRTVLVDDGTGRFALFHTAFREYLLNLDQHTGMKLHRHTDTIEHAGERLLAWCTQWPDHRALYALRHYPEHLYDAARWSDLYTLARDATFLNAQAEGLNSDPQAPLRTLQAALRGAMAQDDAGKMAEFLLAHARRAEESTRESPLDALRAGNLERAWALADLFEIERCVLWHLLLAWELRDMGRRGKAIATLERLLPRQLPRLEWWEGAYAQEMLVDMPGLDYPAAAALAERLLGASLEYARVHHYCRTSRWRSAVDRAATPEVRPTPLDRAVDEARAGNREAARAIFDAESLDARAIQDSNRRTRKLLAIAEAQAQADDRGAARATFDTASGAALAIAHARSRAEALRDVAVAQARSGEFAAAFRTVDLILDRAMSYSLDGITWLKVAALREIAVTQAETGERKVAGTTFATAVELAQSIAESRSRVLALRDLAKAQSAVGEREAAVATIAAARQPRARRSRALMEWERRQEQWDLATIAGCQAELGELQAAHETADAIQAEDSRRSALEEIARAEAAAGDIAAARQTAHKIGQESGIAASLLLDIAALQLVRDDHGAARDTLAAACHAVGPSIEADLQTTALQEIALAQVVALRFDDARKTTQMIDDLCSTITVSDSALRDVALAQADVQQFDDARSTARMICELSARFDALRTLALAQARAGKYASARRTVQLMKNRITRRTEWLEAIEDFIDSMWSRGSRLSKSRNARLQVLKDIAIIQARAGDGRGAARNAQSFPEQYQREQVLRHVAVRQAQDRQFADAMRTVDRIGIRWIRVEALREVAEAQARLGAHEEAGATFAMGIEAVTRNDPGWERGMGSGGMAAPLREIALAQARAGDVEAAKATLVLAVRAADFRSWIGAGELREIGVAQAKLGAMEAARATFAEAIQQGRNMAFDDELSPERGREELRAIAVTQAEVGEFQAAQELAKSVDEERGGTIGTMNAVRDVSAAIDRVLRGRAVAQAEEATMGRVPWITALETAREIRQQSEQAIALAAVAAVQAGAGELEAARATWTAAREVAGSIGWTRGDQSQAATLAEVAVIQASVGCGEDSLRTSGAILTERATHLPKIATALARAGDAESFKALLEPTAQFTEAAFPACGLLARLYPEHGSQVAAVVMTGKVPSLQTFSLHQAAAAVRSAFSQHRNRLGWRRSRG
ncbi:MAG: NACHT domain-containing protein [Chloroflexota bacterium]